MEWNDIEYNSLRCYHDAERAHQYYSSSIRSFSTFLPQQQLAISRIRFYMTIIIMIKQTYISHFINPSSSPLRNGIKKC